ncbi:RNA-directed DNA polymerase, eukaryota, partial [Tanacetum coccineum]
ICLRQKLVNFIYEDLILNLEVDLCDRGQFPFFPPEGGSPLSSIVFDDASPGVIKNAKVVVKDHIKNAKVVVKDHIKSTIAIIGENIKVKQFVRSEELKHPQDDVKKQYSNVPLSGGRGVNSLRSFLNVTKGVPAKEKTTSGNIQVEELSSDLLSQEVNSELELAVLGCHKDFRTIANSKIICRNEGFIGVDVKYLGGLWVLFTLQDKKARDCFLNHEGVLSWFSSLKLWHNDFNVQERLVWLEIEGVPVRAWYDDTFKSVCKKWGEVMFIDNSDLSNRFTIRVCVKSSHQLLIFAITNITLNGVSYFFRVSRNVRWTPTCAHECGTLIRMTRWEMQTKAEEEKLEQPPNSDPFELESLIAKRGKLNANKKNSDTPKYPPGFTQSDNGEDKHDNSGINKPVSPQMWKFASKLARLLALIWMDIHDMLQKMISEMGDKFETKTSRLDLWAVRQVWGNNYFDVAQSSARGTWIQSGHQIMFVTVYAPQDMASKQVLWLTLSSLISDWNDRVIVMGDFNEVRNATERFGSVFIERQADIFNLFIKNLNLLDVPLGGFKFTWTNKWATKMSKLDRFLVSECFHDAYPNITGLILEKGIPDHRPILLKESVFDYGPTPFRFYHSWLDIEGFQDMVINTWKSYDSGECDGMVSFKKKLQNLKQVIRAWNSTKKLSDNVLKQEHESILSLIDSKVDKGIATAEDLNARLHSTKILSDLERKDASDIAQKAKIKWAIEGDENTSFFHGMLKKKRRQCSIKGILTNGTWIEEPDKVKTEFYSHFCKRFSNSDTPRISIGDIPVNPISPEQREFLKREVSNEEIKKAVWECGGDRAPGPDGFNFMFFKSFWDVIQNDVVRFVRQFFNTNRFSKGCNSSFIALIPKIEYAKYVSDFRPNSLIGCQYKIIGKILANRLGSVIGSCVSIEQSAFLKGRNILDGPLFLNECLAWYRKRKKSLMVFKVDFEKAFDSLRWEYLDEIMGKLGFGSKWRKWISGCLINARASVLVNGSPTNEFEIQKGLRQGDPMSPFLFILAMEGLHALMCKDESVGLYKGASIGNISISHLLYADDVTFVGAWSQSNVCNLIFILRCFFMVSRLRININKSEIVGINVFDEDVSNMAAVLGCGVEKLPMTYLGVPVGGNMRICDNWKRIIKKFEAKLSNWKAKLLSIGGRLSLIKAALGNLPTYFMSLYWMPISIQNRLESIRNRFFIGGDMGDKKITWVRWKSCLASKVMGGLDIGSIYAFNAALLFKWIWRFINNSKALWVNVVKEIHGQEGGLGSGRVLKYSHSPWSSMINLVAQLKDKGIDLLGFCKRSVGNGNTTKFWIDSWCGDRPLRDIYPRIYVLDQNKDCLVAQRYDVQDWSNVLRRLPRSGIELVQFTDMVNSISQVKLSDSPDCWEWDLSSSGFSVASARRIIDENLLLGNASITRWVQCIPIKVNIFIWKLSLNKLPTLENLDSKGVDLDSVLCPVCNDQIECVNHIFFACGLAKDLWRLMAKWCSVDLPEVFSISDWFSWLDASHMPKRSKIIIEGVVSTMLWHIWNFRNAWIFRDIKPKKANI